ncbi:MAG: DNA polymerase III subunit delta [Saccharofermentanales bacterium]
MPAAAAAALPILWQLKAAEAADADSEVDDTDSVEAAAPASASAAAGNLTDQLITLLNALPDSVCLVFCEQKVDKRLKRLITAVEQNGILGVFEQEDPATLVQWIEAETKHRGFRIDPVTASSLVDRCDGSMQLIWNELSKIYLYLAGSSNDIIDLKLLEQLSLPDLRGSVFDLTDAVSAGQTSRALTLLDTLIAQKQPVQLITFMLARHYRQLIVAKTLNSQSKTASQLKVMPFVAARLLKQAQSLSLTELESQYLACFEADLAVKTGRLPDRLALETLLISAGEAAKNPGKSRLN